MAQYRRFFEDTQETKVAGLYDLGPTIGKGHYAVVKLARHVFTGESVAVKVIDKTRLDQVSREHLFQEVVCMKLVQHPNVVRLYEVIDTVNKLYLVLELGDGGDLYDYIMKHENGLSEHLAKRYFRQIVTAISYCHNLHVVHRDLKPENVVFFEQLGVVKLTDFGFSNQFVPGKNLETACGSLAYSAPEILLGNSYDAPKVDIWSLGVILYMLVCGHLPFEEANDSETLTKIMDCEYQLPPHLSPACCNLISRLLIRDPAKRALLDEILQDDWLRLDGDELPIDLFSVPLISQEHLTFEDHMEILNKMASGGLASVDEIQMTLNRNEYSYISATYYLLAERKLKRNYIEEYKQLSAQAKMIEQTYMQRTSTAATGGALMPTNVNTVPSLNSNSKPFGAVAVLPKSISASLAASGAEERLRRFSMILEDEEEDAAEQEVSAALRTTTPTLADELVVVGETSDEALMDEEQEELEAVVSLACVRSELMDQNQEMQSVAAPAATAMAVTDLRSLCLETDHHRYIPRFTSRPSSRLDTPSMAGDLSEHVNSESSLAGAATATTSGAPLLADLRKSTASSHSLVLSRHVKRPLRPLISVKSSPQLLKYIAEEDWQVAPPAAAGTMTFEPPDDDAISPLGQITIRQNNSLNVNCSLEYPPSKTSHLPPLSKNALSTLHTKVASNSMPRARSPPWSRKSHSSSVANFGSSSVSSRPSSGMNWMPAPERRRRASVSSLLASSQPQNVPSSVGSTSLFFASRHTPNNSFYFRTPTMLRNRDRRRSGPPGFSVFFLGQHLGLNVQSGLENVCANNSNNAGSPFARISVNLGSSRSSLEASDREQSVLNDVPVHRPPTFAAPPTNMAILRENPTEEGDEKNVNASAGVPHFLPVSTIPPGQHACEYQHQCFYPASLYFPTKDLLCL
uniref:SNF-related serine/threonine-protein kinase n=1 Tax=Schistocephalus solidus TaxID=70667 RepID=A0A0X3PTU7_SCHSO